MLLASRTLALRRALLQATAMPRVSPVLLRAASSTSNTTGDAKVPTWPPPRSKVRKGRKGREGSTMSIASTHLIDPL